MAGPGFIPVKLGERHLFQNVTANTELSPRGRMATWGRGRGLSRTARGHSLPPALAPWEFHSPKDKYEPPPSSHSFLCGPLTPRQKGVLRGWQRSHSRGRGRDAGKDQPFVVQPDVPSSLSFYSNRRGTQARPVPPEHLVLVEKTHPPLGRGRRREG